MTLASSNITDLRTKLFAELDRLSDTTQPVDIERSRAVVDVAQAIINSAKVEVDHMKLAGGKGSGFIPVIESPPPQRPTHGAPPLKIAPKPAGEITVLETGPGFTVTQHRLRD